MFKSINSSFLAPISFFKIRYLPIIIINISYGLKLVTDIPYVFWVKNDLNLSANQIMGVSLWAFIPWTLKIFFAQFIENVEILGNKRKSYIIIANIICIFAAWIMISAANNYHWVNIFGSIYNQLALALVLMNCGYVTQDLIADTMCAELLDKKSLDKKQELVMIQFLTKAASIASVIFATGVAGYLAHYFAYRDIVWLSLLLPLVGLISIFYLPKDIIYTKSANKLDYKIIFFSLGVCFIGVVLEKNSWPYVQEILFLLNLSIIIVVFMSFRDVLSKETIKEVIFIAIIIFAFQSEPSIGGNSPGSNPVGKWWQIDELGFDAKFLALIAQIGNVFGFFGAWLLSGYFTRLSFDKTIMILTVARAVSFLPYLALAFGFHHWTMHNLGFGAKSIMLFDVALSNYFDYVAVPVVLGLMAYQAPKRNLTSWFAMTACFLNLSSFAGLLNGRFLNYFFPVSRGDYVNIPQLFLAKFFISLLVPLLTIILLRTYCNFSFMPNIQKQ